MEKRKKEYKNGKKEKRMATMSTHPFEWPEYALTLLALTKDVYDKRDGFNFNIVKFPHMCSNIPSKLAYGVYISQLVRIGRICSIYLKFKNRHYDLTAKLLKQGFWYSRLC